MPTALARLGDPAVTGGVSGSLYDAAGVTIDARHLDDAADAVRGLLCFDGLAAGDYTIVMTSVEFTVGSDSTFNATVIPGEPPAVFSFGVGAFDGGQTTAALAGGLLGDEGVRALEGVGFALFGGLIVSSAVFLLGMLLLALVFRRRRRHARQRAIRRPTSVAPLAVSATPEQPPDNAAPALAGPPSFHGGSPKLFDDEDTDSLQ